MDPRFPYEYGTDLHWLWGWAQRIRDSEELITEPNSFAGMYFRPDRLAANALATFTPRYGPIIRQIQDYLDHAERLFDAFLKCKNEGTWQDFCIAAGNLAERIFHACKIICEASAANQSDDWSIGRSKSEWLALKPLTKDQWDGMRQENSERIQNVPGNKRCWQFKKSLCEERGFSCREFTEK